MLRKLNLFWPRCLCWPQDEETAAALPAAHECVARGRLPSPSGGQPPQRFSLALRDLERWGSRNLIVWDSSDSATVAAPAGLGKPIPHEAEAFNVEGHTPAGGSAGAAKAAEIAWNAPALWLVSLSDLDSVQRQFLDFQLDNLLRARAMSGHSFLTSPFKLVVVLSKADALPDLTFSLRSYLREDPIWKAVESEMARPPAATIPVETTALLDPAGLQRYLASLWEVHEEIRTWLETTLTGRMLERRAAEYHAQLRYCLVSATGSGTAQGGRLCLPWTPRRVLDPLFSALELEVEESSHVRGGRWWRR